jgi:hypothetical protein
MPHYSLVMTLSRLALCEVPHLGDGSCKCSLSVITMPNCADIHKGLGSSVRNRSYASSLLLSHQAAADGIALCVQPCNDTLVDNDRLIRLGALIP